MKKKSSPDYKRDPGGHIKLKSLVLILILTAAITIFLTSIIYLNFSLLDVNRIEMDVIFAGPNKVGFNLDPDKMHFGKIPLGGNSRREFDVQNIKAYPITVKAYVTGDLKEYAVLNTTNFILKQDEAKKIRIDVFAPKKALMQTYNGTLIIEVRWSPLAYFS